MRKEELMKLEGMTEALAAQIEELSSNDLKEMIPRSRLNEVIAERDNAKKDHGEVLKQLGELQKQSGSMEDLKSQIQKLQDAAKEAEKTHAAEINTLKINNAVESALLAAKALNTKAVKALLNLEDAKLAEDGSVIGLADQIKTLQAAADSKFLFGFSTMKGAKAGNAGNEDGDHGVDTSSMTYSELAAYLAENPDAKIDE